MITSNPEDPPQPEPTASETYILDASAAVAYLLESAAGLQVAALIEGARLIAPEMLDPEVMSALRGKVLHGEIDEARALAALSDLSAMAIERVSHRTLIGVAWRYYHNVTAYDAMYVALAQLHEAPVLTCDGRLSRAPASVLGGVAIHNIPDGDG